MSLEKLILQAGTIVPLVTETSFWLTGIVVLFATISLFLAFKWRKFLTFKSVCTNEVFFSGACKGYIVSYFACEKPMKGFPLWRWVFENHYRNLVNYCLNRAIYELDQIEVFERSESFQSSLKRTNLMSQLEEVHTFLFEHEKYGVKGHYKLKKEFSACQFPFGVLNDFIINKIYVLYKKQSLFILRKKGFKEFSEFLKRYSMLSQHYDIMIPISSIHGFINVEIVDENDTEIKERLEHELKTIEKTSFDVRAESYNALLNSFILMNLEFYRKNKLWNLRREIVEKLENHLSIVNK